MGWKFVTPFTKQCFVVAGLSLNMAQLGMVLGFPTVLLPQLRNPNSSIPIDDSSGSWIAALPGFALMAGNLIIPILMAKLGRRIANILSIVIVLIGWVSVVTATGILWLLLARFFQGLSLGLSTGLIPIAIGEYTSPKNRGPFSISMSFIMGLGTLLVHTVGSYSTWQITALVIACITFVNLLIVIYSPESPSWLANQGRYDDSRRVFRWLRGNEEDNELDKMLTASKLARESWENNRKLTFLKRVKSTISYMGKTLRKKEFNKPIFIMLHLFAICQWAGINVLAPYAGDIIKNVVGPDIYTPPIIVAMGIQRIISSLFAVYIIRKIKRRTMLFTMVGLNTAIVFITAAYSYAKSHKMLSFDHPAIGITLILAHMFTVATGSLPLPYTIAGEIFPLEYRSLSSGISSLFSSINIFFAIKTLPYMFNTIGVHGAYCVYFGIMVYCLTIAWFFLPETKDRTLQDIEDEFRGKPRYPEDLKSAQPLTVWKSNEEKQAETEA
ncbi:hypothetical protein O3G_MSEX005417 [Manduca sexta]|uniref:Major facilitator superfamily (MFS) profile domain-containing protein n=1 Tax=Manduca sexta TaxID=7130 RepID=A0A921Z049_MANSE|nr:hypothetical protein O3G_MSEX005417 [Manduca sexta]